MKIFEKKSKNRKMIFRFFDFFRKFSYSFFNENFEIFNFFLKIFDFFCFEKKCLEKNIFFLKKNIYPLRIFPRFRKSHLEDPAINIRIPWRSKRAKSVQDSYLLGGSSCRSRALRVNTGQCDSYGMIIPQNVPFRERTL